MRIYLHIRHHYGQSYVHDPPRHRGRAFTANPGNEHAAQHKEEMYESSPTSLCCANSYTAFAFYEKDPLQLSAS